jgi:hypothetical protein
MGLAAPAFADPSVPFPIYVTSLQPTPTPPATPPPSS